MYYFTSSIEQDFCFCTHRPLSPATAPGAGGSGTCPPHQQSPARAGASVLLQSSQQRTRAFQRNTIICLGPASWGSQAGPGLTVAGSVPHGPGCLLQTLATLPRLRLACPFPASPAPAACPSPSESQHPVCSFSHWSSRPVFLMAPCAGRWGTPPSLEGGGVPPGRDPHFPTEQE